MQTIKNILTFTLVLIVSVASAQDTLPVQKGDYKIAKLDVLNLMGIGVQKLSLAYETTPMKANAGNLPTVSVRATIPFNSLSVVDMNYGLEAGAELRFYQRKRHAEILLPEGLYVGVGLDGGYVNFNRLEQYRAIYFSGGKEVDVEYNRIRTGIYATLGGQTKLGENLYFDANFGVGWSNVNVSAVNTPDTEGFFLQSNNINELFFLHYREGKGQRIYMPISVSIGYNFGTR